MSKQTKKLDIQKVKEFAFEKLLPAVTGIAKSEKGDIVQALSNTVQQSRKEGFLKAFMSLFDDMCEKGKISPDFTSSDTGNACLQELLDFLDKELSDKTRFEVMKTLFFRAANINTEEAYKSRCLQFMKFCRDLDATELLILIIVYKENQRRKHATPSEKIVTSADEWHIAVAKVSNNSLSPGLVYGYENRLTEKGLIGERKHSDRSGFRYEDEFRLTCLGLELAEYLQTSNEKN